MENTIELKLKLDGSDNAAIEMAVKMLTAALDNGEAQRDRPEAEPKPVKDAKEKKAPAKKAAAKEEPKKEAKDPKEEKPEKDPVKKAKDEKAAPKKESKKGESEGSNYTKDDLRNKWAEIRDNDPGHRDAVRDKLIELGGTSITTLPDNKVDVFYEFLESL